MIKSQESLSMVEAMNLVKRSETENPELEGFVKKFVDVKVDGEGIRERISSFGMIKVNPHDISKIIDIMPQDAADLNKIFTEVSLDENESKQILDVIKEFE